MISLNQHRETITQRAIARFTDMPPARFGFSSFFTPLTTIEKHVSLEVRRNRALIATDVQRCTDPNINTFSTSSEKIYVPPFYDEAWNFNECERYNVTFGNSTNPSTPEAINMINEAGENLELMRLKINRAKERQRAQVLQTGIVTLVNGDNINYKRQAPSIEVLAGGDLWTAATGDPLADLTRGGTFIRQEGKSTGTRLNCIMGRDAFTAYKNNDNFRAETDLRRVDRASLGMPQFDGVTGLVLQGTAAIGDYTVLIWTYNEFFEEPADTFKTYLDVDKVILIADDFVGRTAHAGVPAIVRDRNNAEYPEFITSVAAEIYLNNWIDPKKFAHWFRLTSAPVAVPVSIDRIWTATVI